MSYKDKEKQKKAQHESYLRRKDRILLNNKKKRMERTNFLDEYKSKKGCKICGENRAPCLVFHHPDDNKHEKYGISQMRLLKEETILKEIEKCDVLCSNCHAIL
jgi:hypothetical protein